MTDSNYSKYTRFETFRAVTVFLRNFDKCKPEYDVTLHRRAIFIPQIIYIGNTHQKLIYICFGNVYLSCLEETY
jgi:hypothetical protein